MIARVGLGPGVILAMTPAEQPEDLAELIDKHEAVVETLRDHGILVLSSKQARQQLNAALKSLGAISPDAKKRWSELINFLDKRHRYIELEPEAAPDPDDLVDLEELEPDWIGKIGVLALSPSQAAQLGVDPAQYSMRDEATDVEIAKGNVLRRAQPFKRYIAAAKHHVVRNGEDRDAWFDRTLLPLATEARAVDIVDHYLFNELVAREYTDEHVAWLLRRIGDAGGPSKQVRLIGGVGENKQPSDAVEAASLVRAAAPPPGPSVDAIEIVGVRWIRMPHDRHISFDLQIAIEIPAGFGRFRTQEVKDSAGVSWSYCSTPSSYGKCREERNILLQARGMRAVTY